MQKGQNKGFKCLPNMTPLKGGLMSEKYQSVSANDKEASSS